MFTAFLAYDIQRIRNNCNGFLPCFKHKSVDPYAEAKKRPWWSNNPGKVIFRKYGEILMHPVSKTLVIFFTLSLAGLGKKYLVDLTKFHTFFSCLPSFNSAKKLETGMFLFLREMNYLQF